MVIAAHAHRAVAVPFRATVFEGDVLQRARFHALAAMDACLGRQIFRVVSGEFVEAIVDDMALQPGKFANGHLREVFFVEKTRDIASQCGISGFNLLAGVLVGVELEAWHADVGLRHLQVKAGAENPSLLFYGLTENLFGQATLVAAGAGKIKIERGP